MRVIEPRELRVRAAKRTRHGRRRKIAVLLVLIIVATGLYGWHVYSRPLPVITSSVIAIHTPAKLVSLAWPGYGQSAIGAVGYGVLATHNDQKPVPIASVAKTMVALAVLRKHPFALGQPGDTLTLSASDVDLYHNYAAAGGSVVPVTDGEQISEYQALQALLLPSANNVADSLVVWAFGSMDNYLTYANQLAKTLGTTNTIFADASGFSDQSLSTASDLVVIGQAALADPVIAQVVSQAHADIPVAGTIDNVNSLLGQDGVIGIKTGNTEAAGGCYLFAGVHDYGNGNKITVVGAVLGAASLAQVLNDSHTLITSSYLDFGQNKVVAAGQKVGSYSVPWAAEVPVVAAKEIDEFGWLGTTIVSSIQLNTVTAPANRSSIVGNMRIDGSTKQRVSLLLGGNIDSPTVSWRLKRAY